ncbi:MAG: PilZ domain-containing protein [Terracidiphilus sp.]
MDQAENPIGLTADFDERREMPRCAVDVPVTLLVLSRGTTIVGQMAELSLSGCRVLLPKTLPHAASAAVECTFRIRGVAFRLGGVVEWAESNLAGVRFSAMSSRSRDNLMEVLCEVELENHARQLASPNTTPEPHTVGMHPVEPVPAESAVRGPAHSRPETLRPQVSFGSAASVQAKGTATVFSPAPAAALSPGPQTAAAPDPTASKPNPGRDRRTAHRCGVDTSAVIDLVKVGSKIPGQIVDLSVGGCRVKTADKFPVGIYTRIETEFQLHGLPFRLGGVIQAIHDRNTVGIRFLDMSQRKKDQVAELVAELDESQGG